MRSEYSAWRFSFTMVRSEYSAWRFSFTILLYYFTVFILSENFHILSKLNVNEMGSHKYYFYCTLIVVLSWPEDGRLRPKHVAKISPNFVITASCLMYVVYWRCIIYYTNLIYTTGWPLSLSLSLKKKKKKKVWTLKVNSFGSWGSH